jgi:hypothetical protein
MKCPLLPASKDAGFLEHFFRSLPLIRWLKPAVFGILQNKNVLLYYRNIGKKEYFVVVVKVLNSHGFIVTAYIANVIKTGVLVWKK